jgi:hypothetical protein
MNKHVQIKEFIEELKLTSKSLLSCMREFLKEEKYYSRRIRKFLKDIVNE